MDIAIERVRTWTSGPLDLTSLGLKELPELPAGLTWLYCSYNQLTTLPDPLPAGLRELWCYKNQLTTLPDTLPAGLTELDCSTNQLTTLPDTLPAGLTELDCSNNKLTTLPDTLPAGLTTLLCRSNQLTTLPDTLPVGITVLYCSNNHFPDMEDDETIPEYVARINAIAEAASKDRIVQRCGVIFEDLARTVWHPSRVEKWMLAGVDMEDM
jgi:Leucine-rich repeat (LRR) protein